MWWPYGWASLTGPVSGELVATVALGAMALAASGYIAQRIGMPAVFGYLAAGIGLSPFVIDREFFPTETLVSVSELGVLLLLFLIGAELDISRLRRTIRSTATVLPFDILLPLVTVSALARLMGWSFEQSVALGAAVALSSTLLGERLTSGPAGEGGARARVLGVLVSEDVAAAGLIAFLVVLGSGAVGSTAGGLTIALSVGRLLFLLVLLTAAALLIVPRILDEVAKRHVHELLVLWSLALLALWGYLGQLAGSAELGAFVAGVAAAEAGAQYATRNALQGLRDAAVAVFFFTSGLTTDIGPALDAPLMPIAVAVTFLTAKFLVHAPAAAAAGLETAPALRTAFALGTLGEFSLILAGVAVREGIAHPDLLTVLVGALVMLLPVASILLRQADRIAGLGERLPPGIRRPLIWLKRGLQTAGAGSGGDVGRRRQALRLLVSNALLLAAVALAGTWLVPNVAGLLDAFDEATVRAISWGLLAAISLPLWIGAFRAYRDLVWLLVGLRPGERIGAGKVRAIMVDAGVSLTGVLVLALVSLSVPATLPFLIVATTVAAATAFVAWRRLSSFHKALEDSVSRVLGRDHEAGLLLDTLLRQYPWGLRSTAVVVPPDSPAARRTVQGSRILELTGAFVAVIHRRQREIVNPPPQTLILPGDTLVLMGDPHQLARAEGLVVAHGEAVRMTAQSRQAAIAEVTLEEGSPWVGKRLAEADIRAETGGLLAGIWPSGAQHPVPYDPTRELRDGDRLLVMGTDLQIERVRVKAKAED